MGYVVAGVVVLLVVAFVALEWRSSSRLKRELSTGQVSGRTRDRRSDRVANLGIVDAQARAPRDPQMRN